MVVVVHTCMHNTYIHTYVRTHSTKCLTLSPVPSAGIGNESINLKNKGFFNRGRGIDTIL